MTSSLNPFLRPTLKPVHPSSYILSPPGTLTPLTSFTHLTQSSLPIYTNRLRALRVSRTASYFDRRVTCIEWHPDSRFSNVLTMGSKGGDLVWWDWEKNARHTGYLAGGSLDAEEEEEESVPFLYGRGAGGSITAVGFVF